MIDETQHPHFPQLQICKEQIAAINETLNGNGQVGVGLKTTVYAISIQLTDLTEKVNTLQNDVSEKVDELQKQGNKVQKLIWWGFGALFTANLFMKGNLGDILKTILGAINL
jgi:hypothetical protein